MSSLERERERLEELLEHNKEVLHEYRLKKAIYGINAPPEVIFAIKRLEKENSGIEAQLAVIKEQIAQRATISSEPSRLEDAPVGRQAYRVGVYSYGAKNISNSVDYSLDLEGYFSQAAPSGLPQARLWETELLPRLQRVLAYCNEQPLDTIELDAQVHNSVGIALGSLFPETSRYTLRIRQQDQWWSSRAPAVTTQLVRINDQGASVSQAAIDHVLLANVLSQYFNLNDLHDLCFSLQINFEDVEGTTLNSKARGLVTYMRLRHKLVELQNAVIEARPFVADQLEQTAVKQLIALEVGIARLVSAVHNDVQRSLQRLGLAFNRYVQIGLIGERVENEREAQQIAKTIVKTIKQLRDHEGYRQEIHLFCSLPTALAVMLGCQLNACGLIQLYEYSKLGDQTYYPAWRYNS